jgi:hypothetical protein
MIKGEEREIIKSTNLIYTCSYMPHIKKTILMTMFCGRKGNKYG